MVSIEQIHKDVVSYTKDVLHLYNSSQVLLHSNNDFVSQIKRYHRDYDREASRGFMAEDDFRIHLNAAAFSGEQDPAVMQASLIAFFQAPAYFLESTEYGKKISEERKRLLSQNELTSTQLDRLQNNSTFIGGIAKLVEQKTGEYLQENSGYNFDSIAEEIMRDLSGSQLEAFEITQRLYERAAVTPVHDDIIKAALIVAGRSDNFNNTYRSLDDIVRIQDIYVQAGLAIEIQPKDVSEAERAIANIRQVLGKPGQWADLRSEWDRLNESTRKGGVPPEDRKTLETLYRLFDEKLEDPDRVDRIDENLLSQLRSALFTLESQWIEPWKRQEGSIRYP